MQPWICLPWRKAQQVRVVGWEDVGAEVLVDFVHVWSAAWVPPDKNGILQDGVHGPSVLFENVDGKEVALVLCSG